MRHLLVSYHTCPLEEPGTGLSGGMNVFLKELLAGLGRLGIRTDVLTRGKGEAPYETVPAAGVRIRHLPCGWREPATRAAAWECLPRFAASAAAVMAGSGPYDVVSAHYWMSGVAALPAKERDVPSQQSKMKFPLIFMYHTIEALKAVPGGTPDPLRDIRVAQEERLAVAADRLVFLSETDRNRTEALFPTAAGKGEVIPPGVGAPFFSHPSREEARRRFSIPADAFLFLLAARPDPGKNVAAALEAFRKVRAREGERVRLLVAGQAIPPGDLPEGAAAAGSVPHAEMPALYAAADAVLCPSSYESFGFVPLEAMAAGAPTILPELGYWGERGRREGLAATYPPEDPRGLPRAMRAVSADAALRARLAAAGRAAARAFTWERCAASWARLLASLATPGSPR